MKTIDYLKLIKKNNRVHGKPCSDYRAAQLLGINRTAISRYKLEGRQMDDEVALRAAELLGIDPAQVLADMQVHRSKNPDIKAAWQKIRAALTNCTAAAILAAILSPVIFDYSDKTATYTQSDTHSLNIMLNVILSGLIALILSMTHNRQPFNSDLFNHATE